MSATKVVPVRKFVSRYPGAINRLMQNRENVICRNRGSGKIRTMQFRALFQNNPRFWEQSSTWDYFLDRAVADALIEELQREIAFKEAQRARAAESAHDHPDGLPPEEEPTGELEELEASTPEEPDGGTQSRPDNFGPENARYTRMEQTERVGLLQASTQRLNALAMEENPREEDIAEALADATRDATLSNRAALLEALRQGDNQARQYTREMVVETHKMVKSTIRLVDSAVFNDELVRAVVEKSNGTVVQHMTRVFLLGLEFLLYYNRQVITRGIANRIRIRFKKDYKDYYRNLLPHLHDDYVSLEHVFLGGMKALSEIELNKFATGFLVHDVGKADDIEYHEGEMGYDRETVERHVKLGYEAVMEKTNYPREAALITGYHHEYYGDPHGYGYFREFLAAYKRSNPAATQDYVMAYTMEPLIDYQVLAYFPAKVLEIVDVFDSLTDPNRIYRKPLAPDEALTMIQREFVQEHHKIDPILFDIFLQFREERLSKRS